MLAKNPKTEIGQSSKRVPKGRKKTAESIKVFAKS